MDSMMISSERIREATRDLCKVWYERAFRRDKVLLSNFVTVGIEALFTLALENLYREDWQEEVDKFWETVTWPEIVEWRYTDESSRSSETSGDEDSQRDC